MAQEETQTGVQEDYIPEQELGSIVSQQRNLSQQSRRSRMETCSDILRVIGSGVQRPTHIMYKANLSWIVMQEYIRSLEAQGLVVSAIENNKKVFHLTQKGFEVLNRMKTLREDLSLLLGEP
jgi:predicted transcriptional regulator